MDMAEEESYRYGTKLFVSGDLNGILTLVAHNLFNLFLLIILVKAVLGFPDQLVYGRLLPGVGVGILLGNILSFIIALRVRRTGQEDVTALPFGISTLSIIIICFGVLLPLSKAFGPETAWKIGVITTFLVGVIKMVGALLAPYILRIIPRPAMLGTLAGTALLMLVIGGFQIVYEQPIAAFPFLCLALPAVLVGMKLPRGIPLVLVAAILGFFLAWATGVSHPTWPNIEATYPPKLFHNILLNLTNTISQASGLIPYLHLVIPLGVYGVLYTISNVESAVVGGDRYSAPQIQAADGAATILASLFGGCFPTTVHLGHPAYKKIGARVGYPLFTGLILFLVVTTNLVTTIGELLPAAVVSPLLFAIGITVVSQAFKSVGGAEGLASGVTILPHLLASFTGLLLIVLVGHTRLVERLGSEVLAGHTHSLSSVVAPIGGLSPVVSTLSQGTLLIGMVWGAILAFIARGSLIKAAVACFTGAILSMVGFIHSNYLFSIARIKGVLTGFDIGGEQKFFLAYLFMGLILLLLHLAKPEVEAEASEELEETTTGETQW